MFAGAHGRAKVLEEMAAAAEVIVIGVVVMVSAEAGAPKNGHLHRGQALNTGKGFAPYIAGVRGFI